MPQGQRKIRERRAPIRRGQGKLFYKVTALWSCPNAVLRHIFLPSLNFVDALFAAQPPNDCVFDNVLTGDHRRLLQP